MDMKKQLEEQIHRELQCFLDEYDFDAEIERLTNSKALKREFERLIKDKIAQSFNEAFIKAFIKKQKYIDSFADQELSQLLKRLGVKE